MITRPAHRLLKSYNVAFQADALVAREAADLNLDTYVQDENDAIQPFQHFQRVRLGDVFLVEQLSQRVKFKDDLLKPQLVS